MEIYRFSVWTPTYNRGPYLVRVYEGLVKQTFKDFEWIIIDDGSTDNTQEVVEKFISERKLKSIRYLKKNNGGKHTAWRMATKMFAGKYVITNDSDDSLNADALEKFNQYWIDLENSPEYSSFWEVKGRDQTTDGTVIGDPLPAKVFDSNYGILVHKYRIRGDMLACRKASVLRAEAKVPDHFDYEDLCNNFQESIRWARAGRIYKSRFVEDVFLTCYFDTNDNLCRSNKKQRSIKTTYNNLVRAKYTLEESRDQLLKWHITGYFENIVILLYTSFCLEKNPFKILSTSYLLDRVLMNVCFIPVLILHRIRG